MASRRSPVCDAGSAHGHTHALPSPRTPPSAVWHGWLGSVRAMAHVAAGGACAHAHTAPHPTTRYAPTAPHMGGGRAMRAWSSVRPCVRLCGACATTWWLRATVGGGTRTHANVQGSTPGSTAYVFASTSCLLSALTHSAVLSAPMLENSLSAVEGRHSALVTVSPLMPVSFQRLHDPVRILAPLVCWRSRLALHPHSATHMTARLGCDP